MRSIFPTLGSALALLAATTTLEARAAEASANRLVTEDARIASDTPGIELFLRNVRQETLTRFGSDRTILYIHGSTQPSEAVFDLRAGGASAAEQLAARGYDVWLVNVRGYGQSTRPDSFRRPATEGEPFGRTAEAVRDLGAAVDHIRARRGVSRLALIGWSWGTIITGAYAAEHPDRVASLVLIGPPGIAQAQQAAATPARIGVWQEWTAAAALKRLQAGVPDAEAARIFPAAWRERWEGELLRGQPEAAERGDPPVFRSPAGVRADGDAFWQAGKAFYDPAKITAPTLIVVGEWDGLTPLAASQALFAQLRSTPTRRLVELPRATHFVLAETGRDAAVREIANFLAAE